MALNPILEALGAVPPEQSVKYVNILIYGGPGVGKTWLEGTAGASDETGPVLVADIEGGTITLRRHPGVYVVQIRTMQQFEDLVNGLHNTAEEKRFFKTLAVDGITEMQKLDMGTVMADAKKNARNPDNVDVDVPSPREWGKSGERLRRVLRAARDLEMHTIFTALEGQEEDDDIKRYYPSIPGKLKNELAGFFDIVGRLESKTHPTTLEVTRTLQTIKTTKVVGKDRFSALPQPMINPTIPEIWDLIKA